MDQKQIVAQANLTLNYCIIHYGTKFHFNLESFKLFSKFFDNNPNIIQQYPDGYPIEEHKDDKLYEKSIVYLIDFCQGKPITIDHDNVLFLNELAHKFNVPRLIEIINNFMTNNHISFPIENLIKLQNGSNANKEIYEDVISKNLPQYIEKNDCLLSLNLAIIHRIITKYQSQNQNEPNPQIMEFLFKCLKKFGRPASVLFEKVKFGNENSEYLRTLLSDEYSSIFDFHFINSEYLKTFYDIQNDIIKKNEQLKQQQIEMMNLIKENQLLHNQEIKNIEALFTGKLLEMKNEKDLQIEQIKNDFSKQLNDIKLQFMNETSQKNEQISQLNQQIDKIKKSLEMSQSFNKINHDGIIAKFGDSVKITSGPHTNPNGIENLRKYDDSWFYNYYNETTKNVDGNICKSTDDSQIILDFKDKKIDLFSYFIRSNDYPYSKSYYHPKSWKIEGSNTLENDWVILDQRVNDANLNGTHKERYFVCQQSKFGCQENRYRYIKFTQEDSWGNNKFNIYITYFELYGDDY